MDCTNLPSTSSGSLSSKANAFSVKSLISNEQVKQVNSRRKQCDGKNENQVFCKRVEYSSTGAGTQFCFDKTFIQLSLENIGSLLIFRFRYEQSSLRVDASNANACSISQ